MKKLHKMMKVFAVCVALALVFCMIPVGSVYAEEAGKQESTGDVSGDSGNGDTSSPEDSKKVQVTIENSTSYVGVGFYPDTNKVEELDKTGQFQWIAPGKTETIAVQAGATARIRLYIQIGGYCIPEGNSINGATPLENDSKVKDGQCSAAFEITITGDEKGEMKISIPEAVCPHPNADPTIRWGYKNEGEGKHIKICTVCKEVIPGTLSEHTFKEMTPAEYADWYYNDSNFAGNSAEWIAEQKANLSRIWCEDLGITADTKAKFCTLCEYAEKLPTQETTSTDNKTDTSTSSSTSSQPAPTPAPAVQQPAAVETPVSQPVTAALADAEGVLPTGAVIVAATVSSGAAYEKAVEVIKAQVSGLGEYSVMEINLTDATNTQVHQLNGYVQVTVPMPANITVKEGKAIVVYRLEDDGTLTRCDTTVENGVITFKTNHFSTYIVAEEDVTAVTSPKTEDVSAGINLIFCMGILLAGAAAVAVKRKMA